MVADHKNWPALSLALSSAEGALVFLCNQRDATLRPSLPECLSAAEMARLVTIHHPQQAADYRFSRQLLRMLLARLLNCAPEDIQYHLHAKGKPFLENGMLEFNVSHSGDWLAVAVSRQMIGIDVEQSPSRPRPWLKLAQRFFTATETSWLYEQPEPDHAQQFLRIWTQKEAALKAIGCGLSQHLQALDIRAATQQICADNLWLETSQPVPNLYCSVCLPALNAPMQNQYFILHPELEITPIEPPYTLYHSLTLNSL